MRIGGAKNRLKLCPVVGFDITSAELSHSGQMDSWSII
jgi:hypothetical protein